MEPLLPIRQYLPHGRPDWLAGHPVCFIPVCCHDRSTNQLCHPDVASLIFEAIAFRQHRCDWFVRICLLMPDHAHALVTFPADREMMRVVADWKRMIAWKARIVWQPGFFDHRLRSHESFEEKASYIRLNPCRAGLVFQPEDWPYVWEPGL
jgi:putative transposase